MKTLPKNGFLGAKHGLKREIFDLRPNLVSFWGRTNREEEKREEEKRKRNRKKRKKEESSKGMDSSKILYGTLWNYDFVWKNYGY